MNGDSETYTHISFEVESQLNLLRRHILRSNLVERVKDKDENVGDEIGNIYGFSHNRNFYDSLESLEIYRNDEPELADGHIA